MPVLLMQREGSPAGDRASESEGRDKQLVTCLPQLRPLKTRDLVFTI